MVEFEGTWVGRKAAKLGVMRAVAVKLVDRVLKGCPPALGVSGKIRMTLGTVLIGKVDQGSLGATMFMVAGGAGGLLGLRLVVGRAGVARLAPCAGARGVTYLLPGAAAHGRKWNVAGAAVAIPGRVDVGHCPG